MSIKKTADILNLLGTQSTDRILDYISDKDRPLAIEIRSQLLRFEDLVRLEDLDLQTLLQEIPNPLLLIALKGVDGPFVAKIVKNISQRAGAVLQEELTMLGPKPRREVEAAQQTITATARLLLDKGKIIVSWLDQENKMIY